MSNSVRHTSRRISRADLLRALYDKEDDQLLDITAQLSGFTPPSKPDIRLKLPPLPDVGEQKKKPPSPEPKLDKKPDNQPHYYRVIERKQSDVLPEPVKGKNSPKPAWLDAPTTFDPSSITSLPVSPPDKEPLVAWAKLWPVLRNLLSEHVQTHKPDIPKIVHVVANGHWLERIPRAKRQRWSSHVQLLVDRPERTCFFNQDYSGLVEQLKRLRGATGLDLQRWQRQPGGRVRVEQGKRYQVRDWQVPASGTTIFILSDLGLLDDSGIATRAWLKVGKQLSLAGCKAIVLVPLPERYLSHELVKYFDCISWHRSSSLQTTNFVLPRQKSELSTLEKENEKVEDLLAWLSPAMRVEPALLRAVRHKLPAQDFDVGKEAAAWHHEDAERSRLGFHLQPQKATIEKYRQRFKVLKKANPDQAKSIAELILRYHEHVFPTQRYEEILLLVELMGDDCPISPVEVESARKHLRQLVKAGWSQANELAGVRPFLMHLIDRQHEKVVRENDFYQVVWGAKRSEQGKLQGDLPEGFDLKNVLALADISQRETRKYVLFQEGLRILQLATHERFEQGDSDGWSKGIELANFQTLSSFILKQELKSDGSSRDQLLALDDEAITLPLPEKSIQKVHVAGQELTIERFVKPKWATMIGYDEHRNLYAETKSRKGEVFRWYWWPTTHVNGEKKRGFWFFESDNAVRNVYWAESTGFDEYGLYAETRIFGVTQRFRWIEPEIFNMGSSDEEDGRGKNETQHQVTLSQGYWLADTACSVLLWQTVMGGQGPIIKGLEGKNYPVSGVSWNDIQNFLQIVNDRHPDLDLRLPTETEWENACRDGTSTSFSFGDSNALSSERIHYSGNWRKRKWQGSTKQLKSYPPNARGLYEMHGNVEEWCEDIYGEYPISSVVDPIGAESGKARVLRGGSWLSSGSSCRSASRHYKRPESRGESYDGELYKNFGFRLARGHGQPPIRNVGVSQQERVRVFSNNLYKHLHGKFTWLSLRISPDLFAVLAEMAKSRTTVRAKLLLEHAREKHPDNASLQKEIPRHIGSRLNVIAHFAKVHDLPDLTSLVVNGSTNEPGEGYHGGENIDQVQTAVFKVNWVSYQEEFRNYIKYLKSDIS